MGEKERKGEGLETHCSDNETNSQLISGPGRFDGIISGGRAPS